MSNSLGFTPPKVAATMRALQPENLAETMEIEIPLRMRNYPKLLERIGRGEKLARTDLDDNYLPAPADYDAVCKWLVGEGFVITQTDSARLAVFARGTLAQLQQSFQMPMAKVTVDGIDYSTAQANPTLPAAIAGPVLGVNGLQPYLRPHSHIVKPPFGPSPALGNKPPFLVSEILGAYDGKNLGVNGTGETIAILIDSVPLNSDLQSFWFANSISQTLANIQPVNVNGSLPTDAEGEATLDVSWSSSVAPNSTVRVYVTGDLAFTSLDKGFSRIISDLPSHQSMHQLSISLGLGETYLEGSSEIQTDSQFFATLAAMNVSTFVSSGDAGSNPDPTGHNDPIKAAGPLQVEYFSSDPSVTGVGGTSLFLNSIGVLTNETAWTDSGGGVSLIFTRPAWQVGNGVPAVSKRCVPDVSLTADPNTGAYLVFGGTIQQIGGTSWSTPTWAGYCALVNQARNNNHLPPLGLLNPSLYPLIGTNNFRDITTGLNGAYHAGTGYDLVTGIGVPDMAVLLQTLAGTLSTAPLISNFTPPFGPPLTQVTITGANLDQVTEVQFNGVDGTFTINSAAQITATVPLAATSGPITVNGPNGTFTTVYAFSVLSTAVPNDNFGSPTTIGGFNGNVQTANANATREPGEPLIAGNSGGHSIWYTWTAPASDVFTFDTYGSSFDTLLGIYTGNSFGNLTLVGQNDDAGSGVTSAVSFLATQSVTYHIAVDGSGGQTGVVSLEWNENAGAPVVDNLVPATGTPGTLIVINGGDFIGASAVNFASASGTVSAPFTFISATQLSATVPVGAITGPVSVTTGAGAGSSLSPFVVITPPANDNFANAAVLTGASGAATGTNLGATKEPGEPNHAGNTGGHSVWYSWTATDTSNVTFNTFGSSFNTVLAVYTGSVVNALTLVPNVTGGVSADDNAGTGFASAIAFPAVQGQIYFIAVDGADGVVGSIALNWASDVAAPQVTGFTPSSGGSGTQVTILGSSFSSATSVNFNATPAAYAINSDTQITATVPQGAATGPISVTNISGTGSSTSDFTVSAAPGNDYFASAFTFNGTGGVTGTSAGATKEPGEPNHAGNAGGASVWWNWTAPSTADFSVSTLGSDFDTLLAIYTGSSISSLTPVVSNNDDPNGGVTSLVTLHAVAGTLYHIAVDGVNGASGSITLSIVPSSGGALYTTAFEASEGFSAASPLSGQNAWTSTGTGANGILPNLFAGLGQQAFVGGGFPKNNPTPVTLVWEPVNYNPKSGDIINFQTLFQVLPSTNGFLDDFTWNAFDIAGTKLFAIHFDNSDFAIGVELDDGNGVRNTGNIFDNQSIYTLSVNMDFTNNLWTASVNGTRISTPQPITTKGSALNFGYMAAGWQVEGAQPGDNSMVFDNYVVANTGNRGPAILLSPQPQTVVAGTTVTFSVVASGSAPLTYAWNKNNAPYPGAGPSITINDAQPGDAGQYFVEVTNAAGSTSSDPAQLTVNLPTAPNLTPFRPSGWSDRIVVTTSSGSTTDTPSILSIKPIFIDWAIINSGTQTASAPFTNSLYIDGNLVQNGSFVQSTDVAPGAANAIAKTGISIGTLTAGTHHVTIVADSGDSVPEYDEDDNSYTKTIFITNPAFYETIIATAAPAAGGTITGAGTVPEDSKVTLSATPATNYKFVSWSDASGVVSTKPAYTFKAKTNANLVANFVSTASNSPPAITVSVPTTGPSFATIVNSLDLGGTAFSGAGIKEVTWSNTSLPPNTRGASGKASGTTSWKVPKLPLAPGSNLLSFTVHDAAGQQASATLGVSTVAPADFVGSYSGLLVTQSGGVATYIGLGQFTVTPTGSFTGTIFFHGARQQIMGVFPSNGIFATQIVAGPTIYTINITLSPGNVPDISGSINTNSANATIRAVRAAFNKKTNPYTQSPTYTVELQPTQPGSAPAGTGFGIASINSSGHVTVVGKLADGEAFTAGEDLQAISGSPAFALPFFSPLYGGGGSISGPLTLASGGAPQISGPADWTKANRAKGTPYLSQIQTRLNVDGDVFTAPAKGGSVLSAGDRQVTLSAGNLPQTILDSVTLGAGGVFTTDAPNTGNLQLKVSSKTGLITGSFTYPLTLKSTSIFGIVLQGENTGAGYFDIPTKDISNASGGGSFELGAP